MRIVSVGNLKPGMMLGKSIITGQGQILLRQGVLLTDRYISFLKKHSLNAVYISTGRDVLIEDVINDQTRLKAVEETRNMLVKVKAGEKLEVGKINEVLVSVIDELLLQDDIMINLIDLRSFDEELFSHSVNVAILASLTGIEKGYSIEKLKTLALAALLHDVGLLFVEGREKPAHVRRGAEFLRKNGINRAVLEPVLQHHEHWDGSGYPDGIKEEEINDLARIIQVVNEFDRLSANNRYPLEEVIQYLMIQSGKRFEPHSVRTFVSCVSFYPVGTEVELNTNELAVVIKSNKGYPTRPVVRIVKNMYGHPVQQGYNIDLLQKTTYFIKRRLSAPRLEGEEK